MRMLKYLILVLIVLSAGCAFSRKTIILLEANQVKPNSWGVVEDAAVVYNAETKGRLFW